MQAMDMQRKGRTPPAIKTLSRVFEEESSAAPLVHPLDEGGVVAILIGPAAGASELARRVLSILDIENG
jgi:hypothetical protein